MEKAALLNHFEQLVKERNRHKSLAALADEYARRTARELVSEHGVTRAELAERLGVTPQYIGRWLSDNRAA